MDALRLTKLISEQEIQKRVKDIGKELTDKFGDEDVVAVCILNGSFIFYSDLVREINKDVICDFLGVSSYDGMSSTGNVKVTLDLTTSIEGKNVVLIEDVVDTGLTMSYIQHFLAHRKPKSITTVTLLFKPHALKTECKIDHVGFEISDEFVVGYGLDYNNQYRQLPYVAQVQNMN